MGHDLVDDGAGLDDAGPLRHHGHAESALVGTALLAAERVVAAVGPAEDLCAVVAGEQHDGVIGDTELIKLVEDLPDLPIQLHHRVGEEPKPALALPLRRQVGPDVAPRGVVPQEERRVRRHGAVDEVQRAADELGVDVLHVGLGRVVHAGVRRQRTAVDDRLLADPAPAGMLGRVVDVGCLGVQDVARAEAGVEFGILGIFSVVRFLHGVEVVQDAVELVEAVDGGQIFVAVAQMVLADLRRRIAKRFEQLGDGRVGVLQTLASRQACPPSTGRCGKGFGR